MTKILVTPLPNYKIVLAGDDESSDCETEA